MFSEMRLAVLMISCSALGQRRRNSEIVSAFDLNDAKNCGSTLVCISLASCSSLGKLACFDQPLRSDRIATCCATRTLISSILRRLSFFIFDRMAKIFFRIDRMNHVNLETSCNPV